MLRLLEESNVGYVKEIFTILSDFITDCLRRALTVLSIFYLHVSTIILQAICFETYNIP